MRFIKFFIVGLLNTAVHFVLLSLLVSNYGMEPEISNVLAFAATNMISYVLNTYWTFKAKAALPHYVRFLASSLMGLFLSYAIMKVAILIGWNYQIGFAAQCVLMPLTNYILIKYFVFNPKHMANKAYGAN